jgi:hypothetical protein
MNTFYEEARKIIKYKNYKEGRNAGIIFSSTNNEVVYLHGIANRWNEKKEDPTPTPPRTFAENIERGRNGDDHWI